MSFFSNTLNSCHLNKIKDVVIDPGFGFGKKLNRILRFKNLEMFKEFNVPILVGFSRKSMIYKSLNIEPGDALNGTSVSNTVALLKKSKYFKST